ncbi:hypothetical protein BDP27DRAFT_1203009, partial [Rhodocollybia butyracea]
RKNKVSETSTEVTASKDYIIAPNSICNIHISGSFEGRKDWLIEKLLIGMDNSSVLATPLTWANVEHPYVPLANTSPRPWIIKEGDI